MTAGSPLNNGCKRYMGRYIQEPGPSRPEQPFMTGNRQQVNGEAFDVNRQIPGRLRRINQKQCSDLAAEFRQLLYRLNGAADI